MPEEKLKQATQILGGLLRCHDAQTRGGYWWRAAKEFYEIEAPPRGKVALERGLPLEKQGA